MLVNHRLLIGKSTIGADDLNPISDRLALDFKVSRIVILRRLLTFGYIGSTTYKVKSKEWDEDNSKRKKSSGGSFSLKTILLKNGRAYSSLVIDAYRGEKISYAGVSDYLGLKSKHLASFEKLMKKNVR